MTDDSMRLAKTEQSINQAQFAVSGPSSVIGHPSSYL